MLNVSSIKRYNLNLSMGRKTHPKTYRLRARSKDKAIFLFGANHIFNPEHEQFKQLEKFWIEFLSTTHPSKRLVFVEGGRRSFINNKARTIERDGEAGLATFLAKQARIPVQSPEPSPKYERRGLEKRFTKEEIELYYFARYVYQWNLYTKKPKFETYIKEFLRGEKVESGWKDFDFSLPNIEKVFMRELGRTFNHKDPRYLYSIINPTYKKGPTIVNDVSKASGEIRDTYIVSRIIKSWDKGTSLFVVYGSGHINTLKKLLEPTLK